MAEPREPVEYILVGFRSVLELRRRFDGLLGKYPRAGSTEPDQRKRPGALAPSTISPAEASVQTPAFEIPLAKWVGVEGLRST